MAPLLPIFLPIASLDATPCFFKRFDVNGELSFADPVLMAFCAPHPDREPRCHHTNPIISFPTTHAFFARGESSAR